MASGSSGFLHSPTFGVEWYRHEGSFQREYMSGIETPELNAAADAFSAATTIEEQKRPLKEFDMLLIKQHNLIWTPMAPIYHLNQPWVKGFSGEYGMGFGALHWILIHLWIDQELKEEMGF